MDKVLLNENYVIYLANKIVTINTIHNVLYTWSLVYVLYYFHLCCYCWYLY